LKRILGIVVVVLLVGYGIFSYVKGRQDLIAAHATTNDFLMMLDDLAKDDATCAKVAKAIEKLDNPEALSEWKARIAKADKAIKKAGTKRDDEILEKRGEHFGEQFGEKVAAKCGDAQILEIILRYLRIVGHVTDVADITDVGIASDFATTLADLARDKGGCAEIANAIKVFDTPQNLSEWKTRISKANKWKTNDTLDAYSKEFRDIVIPVDEARSANAFERLDKRLEKCKGTPEIAEIHASLLKIVPYVFGVEVDITGVGATGDFVMMLADLPKNDVTCAEIAKTMKGQINDWNNSNSEWNIRISKVDEMIAAYPKEVQYVLHLSEVERGFSRGRLFGERLRAKCGNTPEMDEILADFREMLSQIE